MGVKDPRVDAYIAKAAPFARPILKRLREMVHESCPEVVETLKWRSPSFEYHGILCGMAAFKAHCAFGFWKHDLVVEGDTKAQEAMGSFGRIVSLEDLPPRTAFARYVKRAMKLNADGVKYVHKKRVSKEPVAMHPEFAKALSKNKAAKAALAEFSPSQQREYLEWIATAKQDATRARRIETAVEWLAEGKPRNWKYMNC